MSSASRITLKEDESILYYYLGKIRAFWEDKVFFTDQRNVAVVSIEDLYIHGKKATQDDVEDLQQKLENSTWHDSPDLYSYVKIYKNPPDWPYNFSGKLRWLAWCAWIGCMPELVEEKVQQQNAIYMPLSYYTGKPFKHFKDKILFGDLRNSVMVLKENFYIYGERCGNDNESSLNGGDPLIHSYIIKLNVLAKEKYGGPEPHLPTWPKGIYGPDTWVAMFAWQGDMPDVVRHQISRFCIIRIPEWKDLDSIMGIIGKRSCAVLNNDMKFSQDNDDYFSKSSSTVPELEGAIGVIRKSKRLYTCNSTESNDTSPVIIPIQQYSGLMKGSLMMADQEQGLMTSFVDVIAFTKDEFYINGIKFKSNASLCNFFQNRKVPLMAWVMPLAKPKVIFNVHVAWRAVCVWFGNTPKNLNQLKKIYDEGQFQDNLSESNEDSPCKILTHFMGGVTNLSFASGVLQCKVTPKLTVKISFKRKAVYMHGYRFQSSCSLLDRQQNVESYIWSVLAYPMPDSKPAFPQYYAVALWQYQFQYFIMNELLLKATEQNELNTDYFGYPSTSRPFDEEWGRHMSGWIIKVKPEYGIIQSGSIQVEATYLYFKKSVLYVDGEIVSKSVPLNITDKCCQCNMYTKPIIPILLDGLTITMEATLVWIGKKPLDVLKPSARADERGNNLAVSASSDKVTGGIDNGEATPNEYVGERVNGYLLMADETKGLMTSCGKIISFISENFYIHGEKFSRRGQFLCEYLHDEKIDIKAWILPLEKSKVILNCIVRYQALCAWIGQEPDDLSVAHLKQKGLQHECFQLTHMSSDEVGLSYYTGKIIKRSLSSGVITCSNAEEPVKAIFFNQILYIKGEKLKSESTEPRENMSKLSSSPWCLLAYTIPPRDFLGEKVNACAVAVWQHENQYQICAELRNITEVFAKSQSHSTDQKVEVINQMAKLSLAKTDSQSSVSREDQESAFEGMHITGKIIKRTEACGLIQWYNIQAGGSVFVKFAANDIYVDLCPMSNSFNLENIQMRLGNFYVVPIQHQTVCGHIVSLLATCGWIGQRPSFIPSPGKQKYPRISMNEIHVTKERPVTESSSLTNGHGMQQSRKDFPEVLSSRPGTQSRNSAKQGITITSGLSNLTLSTFGKIPNSTKAVFGNSLELGIKMAEAVTSEGDEDDTVWDDEFLRQGYLNGHIIELHSNVGRLKGTNGSQLYFSRDNCFLYGVTLRNVELWHVLVQGKEVTYKLETDTTKVQSVWVGARKVKNKQKALENICQWCTNNLVPDGTTAILIEQLEHGI